VSQLPECMEVRISCRLCMCVSACMCMSKALVYLGFEAYHRCKCTYSDLCEREKRYLNVWRMFIEQGTILLHKQCVCHEKSCPWDYV
jgi:hypothetical protein